MPPKSKILQLLHKFLRYWLPPLLWALLIFWISSGSVPQAGKTFWVDFVIKKTAHIIEYAILAILFYRAFKANGVESKRAIIYSLLISVFYGITDELHQLFTPGRQSKFRDVLFDTIGSGAALVFIWKLLPKMPKQLKNLGEKLELI